MIINPWKERLQDGPLLGCFVTFASPGLAEFTARIGFDFTLIDNEHGIMTDETLENMVRASQAVGVPAVVRVPYPRVEYLRRALDMGANGVQAPMVNDAALAAEVVAATHFPPRGDRGVAFLTRAADYGMYPDRKQYFADADASKLVAVHVETVEAINNLDTLLEVADIDVYFVGPGDLAVSMGYAENPQHPDVITAIDTAITTIRGRGKIAGTYVGDAARAQQVIDAGATYIVTTVSQHMVRGGNDFLQTLRTP